MKLKLVSLAKLLKKDAYLFCQKCKGKGSYHIKNRKIDCWCKEIIRRANDFDVVEQIKGISQTLQDRTHQIEEVLGFLKWYKRQREDLDE